jgi:hypothetical protein
VSFAWAGQSLETGESVQAQYSTNGVGGPWTTLSQISGPITVVPTTLTPYTSAALPIAADYNSNFALRFIIFGGATNDYGYIDDVQVTGIPDTI